MIPFLGGAGARVARAGDARTGQMAEFDVAREMVSAPSSAVTIEKKATRQESE